ncbi:MAG: guanine permease [Tistrella sp.]|jgi:AGZA family xanthine/uracil permease-like MFS transporter|uniref:Guanine permease n=1 Tax=Tistrella mobilis TaxID=171437 RepID=A0A3B9ITI0_9PROT|nr:NCS2 family permease [Tistrella sp.]MAD39695.1 guanine permease [Tistrella sp.]MBA74249.1 guanine permease [Tistrella sp.]HAE51124.1 guanine permease [Tistrella mobilis]
MLKTYFQLDQLGTTVRREVVAGVTTFLTMAYIIFVNPVILANTGMDQGSVFVATCVAAAVGSLIMGLYANYPVALAPGMGLNAFFTFTVVMEMGYTWNQALGAVFISGAVFFILALLKVREYIINSIPMTLKLSISAGIGLFLAIIALENAKVIVDHPATLLTLGDIGQPTVLLAALGFFVICALHYRNITGSIIIGILLVTILSILLGLNQAQGIVSAPPSIAPTFFELDIAGAFEAGMFGVIFAFLFVDMFDTAGTLVGVAHRGGLLDKDGKLPRIGKALLADSGATMVGAIFGTSTVTSYIESASGINAGGRSGLTAVVVAILFLVALFFSPLAGSVPAYATAPALLFVALLMARGLAELDWDDMTEVAPGVLAAISMPLTYSIANGIALGFISYAAIKLLAGRAREVSIAVWVLAVVFVLKFAFIG